MSRERERQLSQGMLCGLRVCLAGALAAMAVTYFTHVRPIAREIPMWLDVGFPLAICLGVLHFLRRAFLAWREIKRS